VSVSCCAWTVASRSAAANALIYFMIGEPLGLTCELMFFRRHCKGRKRLGGLPRALINQNVPRICGFPLVAPRWQVLHDVPASSTSTPGKGLSEALEQPEV